MKITNGVQSFQKDAYGEHKELFEQLAGGQKPEVLFITCSDSRIDPCLLTQTKPGDLFVLRNAGNIVPPYGASNGGEAAAVEYAVTALGVSDIVVCGHSQCGAIGGLLNPESLAPVPTVAEWLRHAATTKKVVDDKYGSDAEDIVSNAIRENVLVQLDNLRTHPSVAAKLAQDKLNLHGWVYTFETGQVDAYDPGSKAFSPLG